MNNYVLDRNHREILPGDTLRVFHFIGALRKKHYMYKHVLGIYTHPEWREGLDALSISHLSQEGDSYLVLRKGQVETEYEIVQGYGTDGTPFYERKKIAPLVSNEPN